MSYCETLPNSIGCKDGERWCSDPRCEPYCPDCLVLGGRETVVNIVMAILVVLTLVILILLIAYNSNRLRFYYVPSQ